MNAPNCAIQHPSRLGGYALRPPFKVPGVDYCVGYPAGLSLVDWQSIENECVTVGARGLIVTCNTTLNAIDFSLHNGGTIRVSSGVTSFTLTNSNFDGSDYANQAFAVIISEQTSGSITIKNCVIDGGGGGNGRQAQLIAMTHPLTIVVEYNWLKHSPSQVLSLNGATALTYEFNLIENNAEDTGGPHLNVLQWASATTSTAPLIAYNAMLQDITTNPGEGIQLYGNNGGTIIAPVVAENTMIAPPDNGLKISYFVHGSVGGGTAVSGTGTLHDNYFDIRGAYGPFYPRSWTGYTFSNQFNMVTGSAFSNRPP